jgi:hypothetical protein
MSGAIHLLHQLLHTSHRGIETDYFSFRQLRVKSTHFSTQIACEQFDFGKHSGCPADRPVCVAAIFFVRQKRKQEIAYKFGLRSAIEKLMETGSAVS